MTKIQNSKQKLSPTRVDRSESHCFSLSLFRFRTLGNLNLEFVCYLDIGIWDFAVHLSGVR